MTIVCQATVLSTVHLWTEIYIAFLPFRIRIGFNWNITFVALGSRLLVNSDSYT